MKKLLQINFVVLILLILSFSALAQTTAQIEKDLVEAVKEIQEYSNYNGNYDDEKLSKANEAFAAKMLKYTKNASTLQHKFAALKELIFIATSDDGKFRIYSWDTEDGGTMHNYARVYQYLGNDGKVYSKTDVQTEEGDAGSFVYDIFTVNAKTGIFYVVCSTFIGSTKDHYQSANLYKINGKMLDEKVKLIKTASGMTNSLSFEYDFFSVVDRTERPVKLVLFDKKTQTIKIPVVIEVEEFPNGKVTNKFISYKFNGTNFVKVN